MRNVTAIFLRSPDLLESSAPGVVEQERGEGPEIKLPQHETDVVGVVVGEGWVCGGLGVDVFVTGEGGGEAGG